MISRQFLRLLAAMIATAAPDTVLASALSLEPDRPALATAAESPRPVASFALYEHRETHRRSTEVASPVAISATRETLSATSEARSATREAPSASNHPRPLKLRPLIKPLVTAAELRHALPYGLLDALIVVESGYRPSAISRAGAAGLAQLMPGTARTMGVVNRFDIASSIDGGARYLRAQLDRFESIALALAAYNAGPGAVVRARGIPQNGETPDYVSKVLAAWSSLAGTPA